MSSKILKVPPQEDNSTAPHKPKRPLLILATGFLILGALSVMAWLLFKERLFHYDPAFLTFMNIQEKSHFVVHNRFGMILGQLIPLALLPHSEDLETWLRINSLSYAVIPIIFLLIIGLVFKSKNGVIALCIALTLTFRETFYFSTLELYQSFGLVVLLWVLFNSSLNQVGWKRIAGAILCAITTVIISYFHPITLFLVVFVLLVEYIRRSNWKDPYAISVILWAGLWYIIRIKILAPSAYEEKRMLTLEALLENISRIHHIYSTEYFIDYFGENYIIPFVVCVLALGYLLYQRQRILAAFIVLYTISFLIVILIGMREERSPIMLQNYYTIFGLFGGILLALALENVSNRTSAILLFGIGVFSLVNIYEARYYHDLRTRFIENISSYGQQFDQNKFVIHSAHVSWSFSSMDWALAFGTLMSSEIDPELETMSFYATKQTDTLTTRDIDEPNSFLGAPFAPHWHNVSSLNAGYFNLSEGPYLILNTPQNLETLTDSLLKSEDLILSATQDTINRWSGRHAIEVKLTNNTSTFIGSRPPDWKGVYLYRKLLDDKGQVLDRGQELLLLDLYVGKHYIDLLPYDHPSGDNYMMEIGFFRHAPELYFPKDTVAINVN